MYLPYLMLGYAAAILLVIAGCWLSIRSVPGLRGVGLLTWGCVIGLAGVVLMGLRPHAPEWATILLANEAILAFPVFYYASIAEVLNAPPRFPPWTVGLAAAAMAGLFHYTDAAPSLTGRIEVCSAVSAACVLASAILLFRRGKPGPQPLESPSARLRAARALGSLQILIAAQHAVRGVVSAFLRPTDFLHMDLFQTGFTYSNLILNLAGACGMIWLAVCVHREDLHTRAETDGMTGLLNRRAFEEILGRELRRSQKAGSTLSILISDIDHFKTVNDAWGHRAGDDVLRRVGSALRNALRPSDTLSRYGGEEFAILLRDTGADGSLEIAERLRREIAHLNCLPNGGHLTISIGIASSQPGADADYLLLRCDEALYDSKRAGRNRATVSSAGSGAVSPLKGTLSPAVTPAASATGQEPLKTP